VPASELARPDCRQGKNLSGLSGLAAIIISALAIALTAARSAFLIVMAES
jgi:hypothetical protein